MDNNFMVDKRVGVLGASSFVGSCLLKLLLLNAWKVIAFSRKPNIEDQPAIEWRTLFPAEPNALSRNADELNLPFWICVCPIWVLPDYFDFLKVCKVQRLVVVSSTSRFSKTDSSDPEEQILAKRFADAETSLQTWAETHGIEWVILRPTLIYGLGKDKNLSEIARFIRRFGFFPVFGPANGLRQPIHAEDVANACLTALQTKSVRNCAYNISGSEILSYREMVGRIFAAYGRKPCILGVPLAFFRIAVALLRHFQRFCSWSAAMAERMNKDMVYDHGEAARDFGFKPRRFQLDGRDLPD